MTSGWLRTAHPRVWAMRNSKGWLAKHPNSATARLLRMAELDPRRINRHSELQEFAKPLLSSRGKYEVANAAKRGSITKDASGRARVGGRLRSEIFDDPGAWEGNRYVARIVSPTPYAKYVEFGTHRAPAQPYMRPAANFVRREYQKMLARTIRNMGGRLIDFSKEGKAGGMG